MSLILDALKKADQERRTQQGVPGLDASHSEAPSAFPWGGLVLVAVVVSVITAGAVWWWLQPAPAPEPVVPSPPASAASASSPPAPVSSAVASRRSSSAASTTEQDDRQAVANLYRQRPDRVAESAVASSVSPPPAPGEAAQQTSAPAPQAPPSLADFDHVGGVRDLPPSVQNNVPTLMYAGHDYRPEGNSRIIINDEALGEGERLGNGIRVRAIVSDGVVLASGDHLFKLKALSSWVNM